MKPKFLSATERLDTDFDDRGLTERFIEAYTYVLFFHVDDPLLGVDTIACWNTSTTKGADPLPGTSDETCVSLTASNALSWWERWLGRYWERRLQGIPFPLCADEVDSMLMWLPLLNNVFDQGTDIAIRMPHLPLTRRIRSRRSCWSKPARRISRSRRQTHWTTLRHCHVSPTAWRQATDAINQLLQSNIPDALKTSLEEIIAELGPE